MRSELFNYPNVVLVGKGHKMVAGTDTGREAVVIGVVKKLPMASLFPEQVIPSYHDGKVTDVIEVGEIKALRTAKYRPCPPGVSIGHYAISAGTFGMVAKKDGRRVILSNAHVLSACNAGQPGDAILQPGSYDGGKILDRIGYLYQSVPIKFDGESTCPVARGIMWVYNSLAKSLGRKTRLNAYAFNTNLVDAAIAMPDNDSDIQDNILEIGKPVGYGIAIVGERVRKSGRTTGLTHGMISMVEATSSVDYGNDGMAIFEDQIVVTGDKFSQPGDSGSIVVNDDDAVVGLLFAGSDTVTIVNKIQNVASMLGI